MSKVSSKVPPKPVFKSKKPGDDFNALDGANPSSIREQGKLLYKKSQYNDAMQAFDTALTLNPRSKTIMLEKVKCLVALGETDQALDETNQLGKQKMGLHAVREEDDTVSYRLRFLYQKAETLFAKGDFEQALLLYHKVYKMRPHQEEFRLGIQKAEEALETVFKKTEEERERKRQQQILKTKRRTEREQGMNFKVPEEFRLDDSKTPHIDAAAHVGAPKLPMNDSEKRARIRDARLEYAVMQRIKARKLRAAREGQPKDHLQEDKDFLRSLFAPPKGKDSGADEDDDDKIPPTDRRKNTRKDYAIQQRLQARKLRAEMEKHPQEKRAVAGKKAGAKGKNVMLLAQAGMKYLDTRHEFWKQKLPQHLKEKSKPLPEISKEDELPENTALYTFLVKETVRINEMIAKGHLHRGIENSKRLVVYIRDMEGEVPGKLNVMANAYATIGNLHLELKELPEALAYHMKDFQMGNEHAIEEAKPRALDNLGRVYARTGEFRKAITVWNEKLRNYPDQHPLERAWVYHELGHCYLEVDDIMNARLCGEQSLEAATEAEDPKWQLDAAVLLAQALLQSGEAYLSRDAFMKALEFSTVAEDKDTRIKLRRALKELNSVIDQWKEAESIALSRAPSVVTYLSQRTGTRVHIHQRSYSSVSRQDPGPTEEEKAAASIGASNLTVPNSHQEEHPPGTATSEEARSQPGSEDNFTAPSTVPSTWYAQEWEPGEGQAQETEDEEGAGPVEASSVPADTDVNPENGKNNQDETKPATAQAEHKPPSRSAEYKPPSRSVSNVSKKKPQREVSTSSLKSQTSGKAQQSVVSKPPSRQSKERSLVSLSKKNKN